nr:MAG TPA: hypothetical protein [Caudoviricetes sp.]
MLKCTCPINKGFLRKILPWMGGDTYDFSF